MTTYDKNRVTIPIFVWRSEIFDEMPKSLYILKLFAMLTAKI